LVIASEFRRVLNVLLKFQSPVALAVVDPATEVQEHLDHCTRKVAVMETEVHWYQLEYHVLVEHLDHLPE
jgi:hypothetical protein